MAEQHAHLILPMDLSHTLTNNNQITFPDSSFECGDNPIFMPTWLMKYSKDSEGTKVLHKLVIV